MEVHNTDAKVASFIRNETEIYRGNRIVLVHAGGAEEEITSVLNTHIAFRGKNSLIRIHEGLNVEKLNIYMGEGSYVELGADFRVRFSLLIDARGKNTTIKIGDNANLGRGTIQAGDEDNLEMIVGNDFITSVDFYFRVSDGHTIYDINSGRIVNKPLFGIHIGNHVWCGYNVTILKDADIPNNCIIGSGALVAKAKFDENSIIAGIPAKVIQSGVNWDSRSISEYIRNLEKCD